MARRRVRDEDHEIWDAETERDNPEPLSDVESARLCKTEITADALREFANPTPRIEEPTGLGAVVEDEDGRLWVRSPADDYPWNTAHRAATGIITAPWSEVNAVHVLSPGLPS